MASALSFTEWMVSWMWGLSMARMASRSLTSSRPIRSSVVDTIPPGIELGVDREPSDLLAQGERVVLLTGIGPVLELDDADLGEAVAQPAAVRLEQAELLAVRHDLREQQLVEHPGLRCEPGDLDGLLGRHAEVLPDLLLEEHPVAHPD